MVRTAARPARPPTHSPAAARPPPPAAQTKLPHLLSCVCCAVLLLWLCGTCVGLIYPAYRTLQTVEAQACSSDNNGSGGSRLHVSSVSQAPRASEGRSLIVSPS